MYNRYDARPKGATGIALDVDKLGHGILPAVLIRTNKGWGVVNGEGVGHEENDGTVTLYTITGWVELPIQEVRDAATEEEVDLADFIRVFGDRLDRNHGIWFRAVQEAK